MKVAVNGEMRSITDANLEHALIELGYADMTLATALNGNFVTVGQRVTTTLSDGDQLEVLAPMQGG
jgi:sulfur carrier protein